MDEIHSYTVSLFIIVLSFEECLRGDLAEVRKCSYYFYRATQAVSGVQCILLLLYEAAQQCHSEGLVQGSLRAYLVLFLENIIQ